MPESKKTSIGERGSGGIKFTPGTGVMQTPQAKKGKKSGQGGEVYV